LRAAAETAREALATAARRGGLRGVQILLPVWGSSYLRQCLEVLLPSLLAAGNLPAVAAAIPAVFIVFTRERDMPAIRRHPAWQKLAGLCEARLEPLDELLSEAHSVVLTLVYARAIRSAGYPARDTGFLLLVADYVMADGALREVLRRLQNGADAVLAGNFQISAEAAHRRLAAPAPGEALTISPRALVRLGLEALHPATSACLAGGPAASQAAAHDAQANRVFWRAGRDGLVGRFYLLHMIAVRPETLDVCIAAPCDYSFVPEFCRSGRVETITDSDAYMVAEVQPAAAGPRAWRLGPLVPAALAPSLAPWVTLQHRQNAIHPLCFHAGGMDTMTGPYAEAIAASGQFVEEIQRLLGPLRHPHRHHPGWRGQLEHHQATAVQPPDRAALAVILGGGAIPAGLGRMRQLLLGRLPRPRPWHPHWADWRILRGCLAAGAAGCRVLIVSAENWQVRAQLMRRAKTAGAVSAAHIEPEELCAAPAGQPGPRFDFVLAVIRPAALAGLAEVCEAAAELLADDGEAVLALADLSDAPARIVTAAEADEALAQAALFLMVTGLETVPARGARLAAQGAMMRHAGAAVQARTPKARVGHFAAAMACAGFSLAANLACRRRGWRDGRSESSAVFIHLRRAAIAAPPPAVSRQANAWTA
jgi:hypothetical protein